MATNRKHPDSHETAHTVCVSTTLPAYVTNYNTLGLVYHENQIIASRCHFFFLRKTSFPSSLPIMTCKADPTTCCYEARQSQCTTLFPTTCSHYILPPPPFSFFLPPLTNLHRKCAAATVSFFSYCTQFPQIPLHPPLCHTSTLRRTKVQAGVPRTPDRFPPPSCRHRSILHRLLHPHQQHQFRSAMLNSQNHGATSISTSDAGQYKQMEKLRKWAVIFSQNSHPNMHRYLDDNTNLL